MDGGLYRQIRKKLKSENIPVLNKKFPIFERAKHDITLTPVAIYLTIQIVHLKTYLWKIGKRWKNAKTKQDKNMMSYIII